MVVFPCAKINLGLNIVSRRTDGYHNLQTIFMPIPLTDALEVSVMDDCFPTEWPSDLKITGNVVNCDENKNLVTRAYNILANDHKLPHIHMHLYKHIPSEAGLGGGSSDAAYMLRLLNEKFLLGLSNETLRNYAARLGADCAFFIDPRPAYAEGIGEQLTPIDIPHLNGYKLVVVKPDVAVSTKEAFSCVVPMEPTINCREIVARPVEEWKDNLSNDFEKSVFKLYPEVAKIKKDLYASGAIYAQMSGSGSSIFGLFNQDADLSLVDAAIKRAKVFTMTL